MCSPLPHRDPPSLASGLFLHSQESLYYILPISPLAFQAYQKHLLVPTVFPSPKIPGRWFVEGGIAYRAWTNVALRSVRYQLSEREIGRRGTWKIVALRIAGH